MRRNQVRRKITVSIVSFLVGIFYVTIPNLVWAQTTPKIPEETKFTFTIPVIGGLISQGLQDSFINIINYIMGLVGIVAVTAVIICGVRYIIAFGNTTKMENAKKNLKDALTGLAITILSYTLVRTVAFILGLK